MNVALVFGCARSGTSILGELVAAHPDVKYVFEAHHVWPQVAADATGSHRLTAKHATTNVGQSIRRWIDEHGGEARLFVEKNPRNALRIPFVRAILPEAKLVHVVRDGRDVACSMVPGCGGAEWRHLKPPSWGEIFHRAQGPVRCAMIWKEVVEIALADLAEVPHLQIRYEDLVREPCATTAALMRFLGLDTPAPVLDFCKRIQNSTAAAYQARIQTHWSRDDHFERIGRWRENLSIEEQRTINDLLAPLLHRLHYG
jgi:hypothetical protein